MTGRELFAKLSGVVAVAKTATGIIPAPIFRLTWPMVCSFPGVAGIALRYLYAARLCPEIGTNVRIGPGCTIEFFDRLRCGDNVSIHRGCYLDARGTITIGNDVSIAHDTSLVAFEHSWDDPDTPIKYNPLIEAPIVIADDVWIGAGVRVLAGANIASRSVIAAGAVVTRGEYGQGVYAGVPAKKKVDLA